MKHIIPKLSLATLIATSSLLHAYSTESLETDYNEALANNAALNVKPRAQDIKYAPEASQALIEISDFASCIENIFHALPNDFAHQDRALSFLQKTNEKVKCIGSLTKTASAIRQKYGTPSALPKRQIYMNAHNRVHLTFCKKQQLIAALQSGSITQQSEENVLQFIEDLATAASDMAQQLNLDVRTVRQNPGAQAGYHEAYFNQVSLEDTLAADLEAIGVQ